MSTVDPMEPLATYKCTKCEVVNRVPVRLVGVFELPNTGNYWYQVMCSCGRPTTHPVTIDKARMLLASGAMHFIMNSPPEPHFFPLTDMAIIEWSITMGTAKPDDVWSELLGAS